MPMISAQVLPRNKSSLKALGGKKIHTFTEGSGPWSYPESFVPGALRLMKVKSLLSRKKSKIVLCEFPGLELASITVEGDKSALPSYVTLSHVWKPSPAIANQENRRPLVITKASGVHEISWFGLMQAAIATKHLKCKYMWLDFVCINQRSDTDKAKQIKNMANIYGLCFSTIVMFGGMRRAPRLEDESFWHTRAWTLQEAVESIRRDRNAVRYALFEWDYDESFYTFRKDFHVLDQGLAIAPIRELLQLQGAALPVSKIIQPRKYGPRSYGERRNVPVNSLGQDKEVIGDLLGLLYLQRERDVHPESEDSYIWRALWVRTSSKEHDIIYSSINLFADPIALEVDYARDFESVLVQFLDAQHKKPSVPHWLTISHRVPVYEWSGLLPKRPSFLQHEIPTYLIGQSEQVQAHKVLCNGGCCASLDLCVEVTGASKETGHILCAKILKLERVASTLTLPTYTNRTWQHVRKIVFSYIPVGSEAVRGEEQWLFKIDQDADIEPIDIYPVFDEETASRNEYDIPTGHPVAPEHNPQEMWIRSRTNGADLSPLDSPSGRSGSINLTALCWLDGMVGPYLAILGFYNSHYQNPVVYFLDRGEGGTLQRVGAAKLLLREIDRIKDDIPWTHARIGGSMSESIFSSCNCNGKSVVPKISLGPADWADEWLHFADPTDDTG